MNLQVSHLQKNYQGVASLDDLSFAFSEVSALGILGASGCGKSTLLRQLAGIETPDRGEILLDGLSPILDREAFQQRIGVVFQRHHLFPHLSILRNITLILEKVKGQTPEKAKERALDLLEEFSMIQHQDKLPGEVSGGQAQRASIARALATDPSLIFLDEPTAALDPLLTQEVLQAVEKLKSRGISFVFVTHEMKFLRNFADSFLFLSQGKVVEQGEITGLDHPKTEELEAFLAPHWN